MGAAEHHVTLADRRQVGTIGALTYKMHTSNTSELLYNIDNLDFLECPIMEIVEMQVSSSIFEDVCDLQIVLADNIKMARRQGAKSLVAYVDFGNDPRDISAHDRADALVSTYRDLGFTIVYEDDVLAVLVGEDIPELVAKQEV